jgi:hypothetical protein
MNSPLEVIDQLIVSIITLTGPKLLIVTLLAVGYGLKIVPQRFFPNKFIPLVTVPAGTILGPFFLGWPCIADFDPKLCCPEVAMYLQVYMQGFLLACGTWALHAKVLKRVLDQKLFKADDASSPATNIEPPKTP